MEHIFHSWIGMHRAMLAWFHAAHHVTKGTSFGGDHVNIFGEIYTQLEDDLDAIVEKGLGLTGDETLADPVSSLSMAASLLAQQPATANQSADWIASNALEVMRGYIDFLESIFSQLESMGMSLGLNDMISGFANQYETYVYLLQQRSKASSLQESKMRLTKGQLKKIIREEYSRLKRQGLIKEMGRRGMNYELIDEMRMALDEISEDPEFEDADWVYDFLAERFPEAEPEEIQEAMDSF